MKTPMKLLNLKQMWKELYQNIRFKKALEEIPLRNFYYFAGIVTAPFPNVAF